MTLQAHTGDRVSTDDLRGKLVILFFGFTHCPDICSPTLAKLAALRKALEVESDQVRVVFVTVDPARDTVEQLAGFLPKFDPSFIGLTGTPEEIAAAREYKVAYISTPRAGHEGHAERARPQIDHSGTMFVKDKAGNLRLLWRNEISVADMAEDVRLLLKLSG